MTSTTITRPTTHFGRGTLAAILAGFVGLALAITVAAAMFLNPSVVRVDSQLNYQDFGLRNRVVQVAPESYPDVGLRNRVVLPAPESYPDVGLRNRVVQVAPETYPDLGVRNRVVQVAPETYPDLGVRNRAAVPAELSRRGSDSRLDDYGIRCLVTGWCSQPATNGHR
jgi:hypothetical protein